jgi:putative glycosyltransferase (TIGR04372 family)
MFSRMLTLGSRRLLVTEINSRQYGHLALEMAMSLGIARQEQAAVYFLRPKHVVSEALLQLEPDSLWVIQHGRAIDLLARVLCVGAGVLGGVAEWASYQGFVFGHEFRRTIIEYQRSQALERPAHRALQQLNDVLPRGRRSQNRSEESLARRLYYRRRLLREPVSVHSPAHLVPDVNEAAAREGLDLNVPIVTVHVRESGYKFGREMHNAKPGGRNDGTRNAKIESYFDAIDLLVRRGYTVVRIGDSSMTAVARPGVVDLANSPHRSQLLEVCCMLRSRFLLSGEAGPVGVSYLTNTPLLTVNATDPISSYPIRADGLLLLKHVRERRTRRELTVTELVSEAHLQHLRNLLHYEYDDNTSEEIVDAVSEMLARLDGVHTETATQQEFRSLATEAGVALRDRLQYVRKWGADDGFLGDGCIVRGMA